MDFSKLQAKDLYSEEVICRIMDEPDALIREQLSFDLLDCAAAFGDKTEKRVEKMLKLAEKDMKAREKERQKTENKPRENYTDFGLDVPMMKCGKWEANMRGVFNPNVYYDERLVCSHPIYVKEIITNIEDNTQKVRIVFYKRGRWQQRIISKEIVANKSKITNLAKLGVDVTSETAKNLVLYLSDIERLNIEDIPEVRATAKMGWCEDGFMPYTSSLTFDKDGRFDDLFDTICESGNRQKWIDFVLSVRASGRIEPRFVLAASLASVLLKPCGLLPFWVDIWGRTGGGKSICGMLAASVWADPEIGKYVSKFDSTLTSFETKAGFFNNLPFVVDDTAQLRQKYKDDFSELIYQLASGEGKNRSNVDLGLAYKNTWKNVIICSGETPIITEQLQGGAINRVLEFEADDGDIFPDGQAAAKFLCENYGFLGKEFIRILDKIGFDEVAELQRECFRLIKNDKYESKQLLSLSAVLIADRIATEYIFKDGKALTFQEVERCLTDKNTMSENERCYEYIIGECAVNENKFIDTGYGEYRGEVWGKYPTVKTGEKRRVAIYSNVFKRICSQGGFSAKAFSSWALKKGILLGDKNGNPSKTIKFADGSAPRCYVLVLPEDEIED